MKHEHLVSIVVLGVTILALALGGIVSFTPFTRPDVCPKCHSGSFVELEWAVPEAWYRSHGLAPLKHPEEIPGAQLFWICNRCSVNWTNPFDVETIQNQDGGLASAQHF
jgi:hypothetical protein